MKKKNVFHEINKCRMKINDNERISEMKRNINGSEMIIEASAAA